MRRLLPLLLAVAGCLLAAAPASADHDRWDEVPPAETAPAEDPWEDEGWDDEGWDEPADGWDEAPPPAPAPPAPWPEPLPEAEEPAPAEPEVVAPPLVTGATVKGKVARLRTDGKAAIPRGAPKRVRRIIAAANQIIGKPYKWGGGHARLLDSGYDCSGAVGYALIRAGLMRTTMASGSMARWAAPGTGRWVSVYANRGHVYLEVAGLRLDTSPVGDPQRRSGVRWRPVIGRRAGFHARHPVGL